MAKGISLPSIPRVGSKVSALSVMNVENAIAEQIEDIHDIDLLEEYRAKAAALEKYLRDKVPVKSWVNGESKRVQCCYWSSKAFTPLFRSV